MRIKTQHIKIDAYLHCLIQQYALEAHTTLKAVAEEALVDLFSRLPQEVQDTATQNADEIQRGTRC